MFVYAAVNLVLVGVLGVHGSRLFWPIFPLLGWGIGLAIHAREAYGQGQRVTEDEIQSEIRRLKGTTGLPEDRPDNRS